MWHLFLTPFFFPLIPAYLYFQSPFAYPVNVASSSSLEQNQTLPHICMQRPVFTGATWLLNNRWSLRWSGYCICICRQVASGVPPVHHRCRKSHVFSGGYDKEGRIFFYGTDLMWIYKSCFEKLHFSHDFTGKTAVSEIVRRPVSLFSSQMLQDITQLISGFFFWRSCFILEDTHLAEHSC